MAVVNMKELLETGVHFGHRTRKWNPGMKPFIFTERNNIHIIDLQQTLESLEEAYALIRDTVAAGKTILFVGTKRQAQETIELEAKRAGMPYVNARWLGGTLTNWRTIHSRIDELDELERRRDAGELELLTKKEALTVERRIDKLEERLGGIRDMKSVPELLFVVDVRREETAVHEANLLEIPVIALVDTNCDPRGVDYVIPSNDDAIRAIKLLTSTVANAALEGLELRKDREVEEAEVAEARQEVTGPEMTDEELLGEATLAKLQSGEFDEERAGDKEVEAKSEDGAEASADADESTSADADESTSADAEESTSADADESTSADADESTSADADESTSADADESTSADADESLDQAEDPKAEEVESEAKEEVEAAGEQEAEDETQAQGNASEETADEADSE